ncbi:MAG: ribosome maturation factor RimP [Clostridiales bacterium]|nr:ribosome maturation factor RimP [Clostridiales bacterium]
MSKREAIEKKTEELAEPILTEMGFELVDCEYVKEREDHFLRIYIDKENGITVNDCADFSRAFDPILDEEDYIDDAYIFEVSSPGLGRPLKKDRDLSRSIGEDVEIRTYRAIDKQKNFTGILESFTDSTVTVTDEDGNEHTFNRKDIAQIHLALDF